MPSWIVNEKFKFSNYRLVVEEDSEEENDSNGTFGHNLSDHDSMQSLLKFDDDGIECSTPKVSTVFYVGAVKL